MGSKKTGKERKWIREHSLSPTHESHICKDCGRFFAEHFDFEGLVKNYCAAKMKQVNPNDKACDRFTLASMLIRTRRGKKKIHKIGTVSDDLARKMILAKPPQRRMPHLKLSPSPLPSLKPGDEPREISKTYAKEVSVTYDKSISKKSKTISKSKKGNI